MIRLAIVGLRHPHIDTIIDEALLRTDVELVAIAEADDAIRTEYASRLDVPAFANYRDLFDSTAVEVVGVGAINAHRGRIVADALSAGLHVIADKPLCTTLADLDLIAAAARSSDHLLSVAFEKRFYPPTLAVERILADGELGDLAIVAASAPHKLTRVRRPAWMFDRTLYGGIVNDLAVHDIDLFLHFTGARRGRLRSFTANRANADRPDFQDTGVVALQADDGPSATFEVHWMSPEAAAYHGDYRMRLVGTKGTAELAWKDDTLTVATHDRPPRQEPMPPRLRPAQDFFDALLADRPATVTAAAAVDATRLALRAQYSADHDTEVAWDLTERLQGD